MRTIHILTTAALLIAGCDNAGVLPPTPSVQVDVDEAKGGGGTVEPSTIPIVVSVRVDKHDLEPGRTIIEQQPIQSICKGCGRSDCLSIQEPPKQQKTVKVEEPEDVGLETWMSGGRLHWRDTSGREWYLTTHSTLAEGQRTRCGQFEMKNGKVIDLRASQPKAPVKSGRYEIRCENGYCRKVFIE